MKGKKIVVCAMLLSLVLWMSLATPSVQAQENNEEDEPDELEDLLDAMDRAVNILVLIAGGITTILLIFCVFMWQKEKAENPDSQEAADWKSRGVKVLIGLVIIILARTIVSIVQWIAVG